MLADLVGGDAAGALGVTQLSGGDQTAEIGVATAVGGEQYHLRVGGQRHLGAVDEMEAELARPHMRPNHAIHAVTVRQGQ